MRIWLGVVAAVVAACGSSSDDAAGKGAGPDGGPGSSGGTSGGPGSSSGGSDTRPGGGDGGGSTTDPSAGLPYPFRYGINMGHQNASWGDDKEGTLGSRAGARSIRIKLPAEYLKTWGYDIAKGNVATYGTLGMKNHIGFLIGSETVDLSTAPAGSPDWQNEYYIPKNLYEPIYGNDGNINPNNYWASYIYKVVSNYKDAIKVWHIWNEPDWVGDYHVVDGWKTNPPSKADLTRFNGSIFDYVRMLRVAKEAATKADPDALIATGGIGYPNFLDAILRYSDNPDGGKITDAYPKTGADYFDVVDFHYYPIFSPKSSDPSVDDFVNSKKALAAVLDARGKKVRGWNVSETGAPNTTSSDYPNIGSPEYARNYLIKVMTTAQQAGIGGVDWFILVNGSDDKAFSRMGMYLDTSALSTIDQATKTDTGKAYTTLTAQLEGATYDASVTVPAGARGVGFKKDGKRRMVIWAATTGTAETASTNVTIDAAFDVVAWDGTKAASGTVALTGSPLFLTER